MVELAPVVPNSQTKTWVVKCLLTLLVVFKVVTEVIPDPLVDSHKEAMRRQPCGMMLLSCTAALAAVVINILSHFTPGFLSSNYLLL